MKLFILLLISSFLYTCSSTKNIDIFTLFEKELKVIKVSDSDVSDLSLTLAFQEDKKGITGFSGCNNYFGMYSLDGDNIVFSKIGATKKYCNGISEKEKLFLKLLATITNYNVTGDKTIELLNSNKEILVILKP